DETHVPDDFERVAWRRGLEDMRLTGNRSMLGVLDLPALLELRVPGASGPCYAAITGLDERRATLTIGSTPTTIDAGLLDLFWFGQAHVLWRDFEGLGMTFGLGARGAHVTRLQGLLRRTGLYGGESTGEFDPATVTAVIDFQRSRLLIPDARVGRLTRIVLYAAAGVFFSSHSAPAPVARVPTAPVPVAPPVALAPPPPPPVSARGVPKLPTPVPVVRSAPPRPAAAPVPREPAATTAAPPVQAPP